MTRGFAESARGAARRDAGFTMVEAAVAMSVMALGLMAALSALDRGVAFERASTGKFLAEDRARGALSGLFDALAETSIATVDTTMRVRTPTAPLDVGSDRFTIAGATLNQCASTNCPFHTHEDLTVDGLRFACAFEYLTGVLAGSTTRGKVLPASIGTCPYCSCDVAPGARLDGIRFFTARDASGGFAAAADGSPRWSNLVFVFPAPTRDGLTELRRYDLYVEDFVAAASYAPGFALFDKTAPSLVDLLDFGADGGSSSTPDGSVPRSLAGADSEYETFTTALDEGVPTLVFYKERGSALLQPHRKVEIRINLETGAATFDVAFTEAGGAYWIAQGTTARGPRTLVRGLTEFAVSTASSCPYDAATNPSGVADAGVVRVTLGTSMLSQATTAQWTHHVERFAVRTRNGGGS